MAAGCLGGTVPTRFYVLAAVDGPVVSGDRALSVGAGPVNLAGYLDRPQIVTRPAADKVDLAEARIPIPPPTATPANRRISLCVLAPTVDWDTTKQVITEV